MKVLWFEVQAKPGRSVADLTGYVSVREIDRGGPTYLTVQSRELAARRVLLAQPIVDRFWVEVVCEGVLAVVMGWEGRGRIRVETPPGADHWWFQMNRDSVEVGGRWRAP